MQENSNKIVNKFLFKIYFLYKLGGASEIKSKTSSLILYFSQLALILHHEENIYLYNMCSCWSFIMGW